MHECKLFEKSTSYRGRWLHLRLIVKFTFILGVLKVSVDTEEGAVYARTRSNNNNEKAVEKISKILNKFSNK